MAVDQDRRLRAAGWDSMEAEIHQQRGSEAMRSDLMRSNRAGGDRMSSDRMNPDRTSDRIRLPARVPARGAAPAGRRRPSRYWHAVELFLSAPLRALRHRWMRRAGICLGSIAALIVLAAAGLWMLLASGPVSLDMVTPWIADAVAGNLGKGYHVDIGGTVLEYDEQGRPAMRIRSITVRDQDGTLIAHAPKAEVGLSNLLSGRPRARSLNLVGAELAVRIEADGKITMSTGADQPPVVVGSAPPAAAESRSNSAPLGGAADMLTGTAGGNGVGDAHGLQDSLMAFLAWVDSLRTFGLDGGELTEVGLKSGNLVVDDRRNGQQSRFENIHLILTRPYAGALDFELGSEDPSHPWLILASIKPGPDGARTIDLETRRVLLKDLLLAARIDGGQIDTDIPLSARIRGEFGPDGHPHRASGRIELGAGSFVDTGDPAAKIAIDRAEMHFFWNASDRLLSLPFEVYSGATALKLSVQAEAPLEPGGAWTFNLNNTSPAVLAPASPGEEPLVLSRLVFQGRLDQAAQRFEVNRAEAAGRGVGIVLTGSLDYSTPDPRLKLRLTTRKLPLAAFKALWPPLITPPVREWIVERSSGGMIEEGEITTDAPISTLRSGGPPVADDGLSIVIHTTGVTLQPFDNLPAQIRDADLVSRTRGQNVVVTLAHGTIQMQSGRKLAMSNGVFEVADTSVKSPPAKVRTKIEGPMAAAAELLSADRLRDSVGLTLDPATTRGNVAAVVNLGLPLAGEVKSSTLTYAIAADITNFSADHLVMSQKVEAQTLHVAASDQGYQLKGDMRVGGAPVSMELHRGPDEPDSELHLTGTLDDAARARFGLDANGAITGPVGIKINGRLALSSADSRLIVEADFTHAKVDNLLPGWTKASKTPAKAAFTYIGRNRPARIEDIAFDGNGASIRGSVEFNQNGDFVSGTFPAFGLAEGDKTSLQLERTPDNVYKITVRGDTFDGRNFIKAAMSGSADPRQRRTPIDIDVDAKVGIVAGCMGEMLRNLDLHVIRRNDTIRSFTASGQFAGDGALQGQLRGKPGGAQTLYVESSDAGALFRFSNTYSRMFGGQMWIAIDPPAHDGTKKEGFVVVRDFTIRGEAALDSMVARAPNGTSFGMPFSQMRVDFTRQPGKMTIQRGLVKGPLVGGTVEGVMDYAANEVRLHGTFVPAYAVNTAFAEVPFVGTFLLGGDKGMIGSVNYEVTGNPGAPVLHVNPLSIVTPGFTREILGALSNLPNDHPEGPNWDNAPR